jgi:conjugative transfer signal peptidase TraF
MARFAAVLRRTEKFASAPNLLRVWVRFVKWVLGSFVVVLALSQGSLTLLRWAGYELNLSPSVPVGLYAATEDSLYVGQMVSVCLPAEAAQLGHARGYIGAGECEDGTQPVLKMVVAMEGDRVEVKREGVRINGELVPRSRVRTQDSQGRALPHVAWEVPLVLGRRQLWLWGPPPSRTALVTTGRSRCST